MLAQIVKTYTNRFNVHKPYFEAVPREDACLIICIPAFKEPDILTTLCSLAKCIPPSRNIEVIIVVNAPENATPETLEVNKHTVSQINHWIEKEQPNFINAFIIREESIPKKDAGAGYARKIGMDEAVQRWAKLNSDGPIICLDADCTVSENYLIAAEEAFRDKNIKVGHFHFEHEFENEKDTLLRKGIVQYELHLRCYIEGLRQAGYPNAIHTVGSSMILRASSYAKAGGMNKRKAGEDFYFLHKLVPHGGWKNISNATVYPSCRVSDRVPFGTGRAQLEWVSEKEEMLTYNSGIYEVLKPFFEAAPNYFKVEVELGLFHKALQDFLNENQFANRIQEIRDQSNSAATFLKRYWQWMDGFMVLKLTHYLRDNGFPNQPIAKVSQTLLKVDGFSENLEHLLMEFRKLD